MENNFKFQESAAQIAAEANQDALDSRQHRDAARGYAYILDGWNRIMANASPLKATIIAAILAMLNMLTSWEMNWDILDQTGLFQTFGWEMPPAWSPLIIALPLEALAFWVASWLGKAYFSDIFELVVWNRINIVHNGRYHAALAKGDEQKNRKIARFWFWFLFGLLVVAQGGISLHRIQIIENNPVAVLLAVLAFVFLIGEVIAGVYLDFLLKKNSYSRKLRQHQNAFREKMASCGANDRIVCQLLEKARETGEFIELNGDQKRSIYRHKRRALDSENYVDEVSLKHATVEVVTTGNVPVSDVRVVGSLNGGGSTDASYTDEKGITIIYWDSREDAMVSIRLNDVEIPGPFSKEQIHRLHLSLNGGEQMQHLGK